MMVFWQVFKTGFLSVKNSLIHSPSNDINYLTPQLTPQLAPQLAPQHALIG